MGYRAIPSPESPPPSGESPIWVASFNHYAEYVPGTNSGYLEFYQDIALPEALAGDELMVIEMTSVGDSGGDLIDTWIADGDGNQLAWPPFGTPDPWYSRTRIFRAPSDGDITDYLTHLTEGRQVSGSSAWMSFGYIDYGRGLAGIDTVRLAIGLQPYNQTAWARMRGFLSLYRPQT